MANSTTESPLVPQSGNAAQKPPARSYLMQYFEYQHLPPRLQVVSRPFCELAERLETDLPMNPEKLVALRKLLEAKDCAVRAAISK